MLCIAIRYVHKRYGETVVYIRANSLAMLSLRYSEKLNELRNDKLVVIKSVERC